MFFSHGTEHGKGVLILIRNSLQFELKTTKVDKNGCFIILEANVQDHPFVFVNLYAPNNNEQSTSFQEIHEELDNFCLAEDCKIVIGGDFKGFSTLIWLEMMETQSESVKYSLMISLIYGGSETQI